MAEIINLRQARKQRDRTQREAEAAENRRKFGRTKSERVRDDAEDDQARRHLDGHRLERKDGDLEP